MREGTERKENGREVSQNYGARQTASISQRTSLRGHDRNSEQNNMHSEGTEDERLTTGRREREGHDRDSEQKNMHSEGTEDKRLTTGRRENRKEREREGEKDRDKEKGKVKRGCPTRRQQTL